MRTVGVIFQATESLALVVLQSLRHAPRRHCRERIFRAQVRNSSLPSHNCCFFFDCFSLPCDKRCDIHHCHLCTSLHFRRALESQAKTVQKTYARICVAPICTLVTSFHHTPRPSSITGRAALPSTILVSQFMEGPPHPDSPDLNEVLDPITVHPWNPKPTSTMVHKIDCVFVGWFV